MENLRLGSNNLDLKACDVLSKAPFTAHLKVLSLEYCGLASKKLAALLEGTWPMLWRLGVHGNKLVDEDAEILVTKGVHEQMREVDTLIINDNQLTEDGKVKLKELWLGAGRGTMGELEM